MTGPDFAIAVHKKVARFCKNPGRKCWEATVKIFQCLAGTPDRRITYGVRGGNNELLGFAEANFATNLDERFSVSGGVVMIGSAAISRFSRMQRVPALSSTEAEYMALAERSK